MAQRRAKAYLINEKLDEIISEGAISLNRMANSDISVTKRHDIERRKKRRIKICTICSAEFIRTPHSSTRKCLKCQDAPYIKAIERSIAREEAAERERAKKDRKREEKIAKDEAKKQKNMIKKSVRQRGSVPLNLAFFDVIPPLNK